MEFLYMSSLGVAYQYAAKGSPLQFIVDNTSQKNLISVEVMKWLVFLTIAQPQPYTIGWLHQG
jgi:hypothetical protein